MKRRILLPTDFSKNAQHAMDYAIDLYKDDICDFYILNTYSVDPFLMELTAARDLQESKNKSISGLNKILKKLTYHNDSEHHHFKIVSECDPLIEAMNALVDKHDIYMVIMGTKGDTDSSTEIYGSQTVLAMEKIRNCPVLAIPEKVNVKELKEIVFPTDYKTPFKRREFQYLVDIAKISGAGIRILHVLDKDENIDSDQRNNQKLLKDYFEGLEYTFHTAHHKDVQMALNAFIERRGSDMVAFINKKHSFFGYLLSKPLVKDLGSHATIPVLALHDFKN
jgi:nucleotide-binding universal stress UspA family protein